MKPVTVVTVVEKRPVIIPPARPPLWMHHEDIASGVFLNEEGNPRLRTCATTGGCPAVFILRTPRLKVKLTKDWQFAIWAANYLMTPEEVVVELDDHLGFCNQTGLRSSIPRRNYLEGKDLAATEYPRFDKDRTCSRSVMTGTVGYSLMQAIKDIMTAVRQRSFMATRSAMAAIADINVLNVLVMDGNQPPLMKPGKSLPATLADVNPDNYLYNPREHRWMFFAANTVASMPGGGSKVYPFPRGKVYPWTGDGWKYTWMPHVSREAPQVPLSRLRKLAAGETVPSPYRSA